MNIQDIQFYYRCEVKGIQNYIMRGKSLKELAGASALIDGMMTPMSWGLLGKALRAYIGSNWQSQVHLFYYAAGGATLGFKSEKDLLNWVNTWPIVVEENIPNIHIIQAWIRKPESESDIMYLLNQKLVAIRNLPPVILPHIGPLVERTRLGNAAVDFDEKGGYLDEVNVAQRNALNSNAMQNRLRQRFFPNEGLFEKISKSEKEDRLRHLGINAEIYADLSKVYQSHQSVLSDQYHPMHHIKLFKGVPKAISFDLSVKEDRYIDQNSEDPTEFTEKESFELQAQLENQRVRFAYETEEISGENRSFLGVLHIDGNRIGRLLVEYDTPQKMTAFSQKMSAITFFAVWTACENTFEHRFQEFQSKNKKQAEIILPIRPIVVGGDDVTAIIRSDLALNFIEYYCLAFEFASECLLGKTLTASAGLAFVKTNHPFRDAEQLAQALCKKSKRAWLKDEKTSASPSLVSFQRVTQSLATEEKGFDRIKHRMAPFYLTGGYESKDAKDAGLIELRLLRNLAFLFQNDEISKGSFRTLLDVLDIEQPVAKNKSDVPKQLNLLSSTSLFRRIIQIHQKRYLQKGRRLKTWPTIWALLQEIHPQWQFNPDQKDATESIDQQYAWAYFEQREEGVFGNPWIEILELQSIDDDFDRIKQAIKSKSTPSIPSDQSSVF
jgi:hypothetical protein